MTAAPDYTTDTLITTVLDETSSPLSQNLLTQNTVLGFLDREMRTTVAPLIISVREEFFVNYFDQAVTGAASYTMPQASNGAMLRDIVFVDQNGNEVDLNRFQPEQIKTSFPTGFPVPIYSMGYYLKDDQVVLWPQQTQTLTQFTLRMKFMRRPNNLTLTANCGQITNITNNAVTVSSVDSTWTTATTFDVVQNFPQFNTVISNASVTSIPGSVLNFTNTPTGAAVGMYVCPHLMTCIPQIPYEAYDLLLQRAIVRAYRAIGDSNGLQTAEKLWEELRLNYIGLITPRVQGGRKIIVNKNNVLWHGFNSPFVR